MTGQPWERFRKQPPTQPHRNNLWVKVQYIPRPYPLPGFDHWSPVIDGEGLRTRLHFAESIHHLLPKANVNAPCETTTTTTTKKQPQDANTQSRFYVTFPIPLLSSQSRAVATGPVSTGPLFPSPMAWLRPCNLICCGKHCIRVTGI